VYVSDIDNNFEASLKRKSFIGPRMRQCFRNFWLTGTVFALIFVPLNMCHAAFPKAWQLGFQQAESPVMQRVAEFHDFLLMVTGAIAIVVSVLLATVLIRFRKKRNSTPSKTSHNTLLEVIWTAIPTVIVMAILIPSFKLLYFMDVVPESEMTVKIVAHQWYWSYEYPDHDNISYDSYMIPDEEIKENQFRLLSVDNPMVVPVGTTIRLITTSTDVIHSWAVPSLGIKKDSVPGRLNEIWVRIEKEGTYYGQCSELCGPGHGFMPIEVRAVSKGAFQTWVLESKTKLTSLVVPNMLMSPNDFKITRIENAKWPS
jgi:cytochrome c oxidase subunit II